VHVDCKKVVQDFTDWAIGHSVLDRGSDIRHYDILKLVFAKAWEDIRDMFA
jgi:hypothetical protein